MYLRLEHSHKAQDDSDEKKLFCLIIWWERKPQTPNCHHSSVETGTGVLLSQDAILGVALEEREFRRFPSRSSIPGPLNPSSLP